MAFHPNTLGFDDSRSRVKHSRRGVYSGLSVQKQYEESDEAHGELQVEIGLFNDQSLAGVPGFERARHACTGKIMCLVALSLQRLSAELKEPPGSKEDPIEAVECTIRPMNTRVTSLTDCAVSKSSRHSITTVAHNPPAPKSRGLIEWYSRTAECQG